MAALLDRATARRTRRAAPKARARRPVPTLPCLALDGLPQAVLVFDAKLRLLLGNAGLLGMLNVPPALLAGRPRLVEALAAGKRFSPEALRATEQVCAAAVARTDGVEETAHLDLANGLSIMLRLRRIGRCRWVAVFEDVTEFRATESRALALALTDPLTGLANRRVMRERLGTVLAAPSGREAAQAAVFCIDLDNFKPVNDTLGHPMGDALLRAIAGRLRAALRGDDLIARVGGDEFVVIQEAPGPEGGVDAVAARMVDLLGRPFILNGNLVNVGASIGYALSPADASDPDALLRCADLALYQAKAGGRRGYRRFTPEMEARARARRLLEQDLRKALALSQFELAYQPKVNLRSGRLAGFEALLRWRHPERGLISPGEFIPVCEEIGLIVPLGEWVLRTACLEAAGWPAGVAVAVNVSAPQFEEPRRLVGAIGGALARARLDPQRLEVEITESVLLRHGAATRDALHAIRRLGVRISMDDFGTGYSSLTQLQSFPFDRIKIDRSFVQNLLDSAESAAIVRAVAALGASLGIATTAEGVETEEQLARIRADGCTEVQGYLFSRPVGAAEIGALIASLGTAPTPRLPVEA
ncbi:MAG: EAL domain-containing protein [Acidisphaera sp.]|nr:EAL domain-containing protein [Acidisphaera sp.]